MAWPIRSAALCVALYALTVTAVVAEPPPVPIELTSDATLHDVLFLDPDRGWAVGDRGTILRTDDGGRHWRSQESPVGCRLNSVAFLDDRNGWIVGGWTQPGTFESRAVILRTRDGGQNWMPLSVPTLPALRRVRFLDERFGWAAGDGSPMYASGVFHTADGGRSWTPLPPHARGPWLAAEFFAPHTSEDGTARPLTKRGIVAGPDGALAIIHDQSLVSVSIPGNTSPHLRHVRMSDHKQGWLVGDGGTVLVTRDGGLNWLTPDAFPPEAARQFDWTSVAVHGGSIWLVGAPGSGMLHSPDHGKTWELLRTGQSAPLHSVCFIDANHGWACGTLGTILATRDGGRTWRPQRGGGRVALLGIFSDERRVPFEVIAQASGQDGYLSHIELPFRRDLETPARGAESLEQRVIEAVLHAGGSNAHIAAQFPVRQRGLRLPAEASVANWDQIHGGHGLDELVRYLVQRIRTWRPEVIITEDPGRAQNDSLSSLTRQVVLLASQQAADPAAFPDQLAQTGLETWRVKKVFSTVPGDERGAITVTTAQLAPRTGRSLAEIALTSRSWLVERPTDSPPSLGLRLVIDQVPQEFGRRDLMSGVTLANGEGRRTFTNPSAIDASELTRSTQKRNLLRQLLARSAENPGQAAALLGQLDELTRGMNRADAGDAYWQLGQRFANAGQMELAADTFQFLLKRDPHHLAADSALMWLVHYYASGEMAWRRDSLTARTAQQPGTVLTPGSPILVGSNNKSGVGNAADGVAKGGDLEETKVVPASATVVDATRDPSIQRNRLAAIADYVQRTRPSLYEDPYIRFPATIEMRAKTGPQKGGDGFLNRLASPGVGSAGPVIANAGSQQAKNPWVGIAAGELWLQSSDNSRTRPSDDGTRRPAVTLPLQTTRPRLDGQLDDELWTNAQQLDLKSEWRDDDEWSAVVRLARDDEYLYVAATCRKAPGCAYQPGSMPRPRDAVLDEFDRLELLLDIDRDYVTFYRLTIDQRGWTRDECWGDASWNPTWYVAARQDETHWTVELAIPWSELTPRAPRPAEAWAVGVQRVVPRVGFQSWSQPAAAEPRPEGLGIVQFK